LDISEKKKKIEGIKGTLKSANGPFGNLRKYVRWRSKRSSSKMTQAPTIAAAIELQEHKNEKPL